MSEGLTSKSWQTAGVKWTGQLNWFTIHHKLMKGGPNPNHHVGLGDIFHRKPTFNVVNEVTTEQSDYKRCSSIPNKNTVVEGNFVMIRFQLKKKLSCTTD